MFLDQVLEATPGLMKLLLPKRFSIKPGLEEKVSRGTQKKNAGNIYLGPGKVRPKDVLFVFDWFGKWLDSRQPPYCSLSFF